MQKTAIQILDVIKKDNITLFSSIIKNNQDLCLGRFPILSLCYLYKAKKIIKKFEKSLLAVKTYKVVYEPFEIYIKFKDFAKRCLRLYLDEQIVEPIEMLAILGKDCKVKKLIKQSALNNKQPKANKNKLNYKDKKCNVEIPQQSIDNLNSIYLINKQSINIKTCQDVKTKKVTITKKPFSLYQKNLHKMAMIFSGCFVVVLGLFYLMSFFVVGLGIKNSPFFVYSQSQLVMALKNGGNYELKNNITLTSSTNLPDFDGTLNGNNFTININGDKCSSLINKNSGNLKNLNIIVTNINKEISNSLGLVCKLNTGSIENVNVVSNGLNLTCNKSSEDINLSGLTNNNSGTIKNCNLKLNADIKTKGDGECNFAGFANINSGEIINCTYESSQVMAEDCDASGIVITNNFSASVVNCKNYAAITQKSVLEKWSPNVAGVVLSNNGVVKNCYNFASLNVNSLATLEDSGRAVYVGGIAAINCGEIDKCLNKGNVTVSSKMRMVYAGGICGETSYYINEEEKIVYTPKINNCGVDCELDVQTEGEKCYVFCGGINGFLSDSVNLSYYVSGEINNCYSLAKINVATVEGENKKYFNGSFLGMLQFYVVQFAGLILQQGSRLSASGNLVLDSENNVYQVGAILTLSTISLCPENVLDDAAAKPLTKQEILQSEVYWNE